MNRRRKATFTQSIARACLSLVLTCSLLVPGATPLKAAQSASPGRLSVDVLAGEGWVHDINDRAESQLTVRVVDAAESPVSGAVVVFQLPASGPGAAFFDGLRFVTKLTDKEGLATAWGLRPNSIPGEFNILVTASYRDFEPATLEILQRNLDFQAVQSSRPPIAAEQDDPGTRIAPMEKRRRGPGLLVAVVAILGGAAAGATLGLATRRSTPNTAPPPAQATTIVAGAPAFGPPGASGAGPR